MNLDEIISEMNLGGKIKDTRERKEILRTELAEFAGVSEDYIAEIENNERLPDYDTVLLIKELLDLNMDLTWLKIIEYLGVI
ncbi:MAG: helix-turn-helix transcriptional regulator [Spirochaetes bacterium]|nr:helix-turn-helix transcriptional regulator [Spirochaetota bacterium]